MAERVSEYELLHMSYWTDLEQNCMLRTEATCAAMNGRSSVNEWDEVTQELDLMGESMVCILP